METLAENWWLILVGLAILFVLLFLLLKPRQRVRLTDSAPLRPHMAKPAEGRGLVGEAAAATSDVTGDILGAPVHKKLDQRHDPADDLSKLKGVGPRFAEALAVLGFVRFEQIAGLSETEVDRLDSQLGAFRGRITRDRIVEQAAYLARNDVDGFEQKFGKL